MTDPIRPPAGDPSAGARESAAAAVRALWERHRSTVLARVEAVEEAALAVSRGALPADLRAEALLQAHRLVGTLGIFGLAEGTQIARRVEAMLQPGARHGRAAGRALLADAAALRREVESLG